MESRGSLESRGSRCRTLEALELALEARSGRTLEPLEATLESSGGWSLESRGCWALESSGGWTLESSDGWSLESSGGWSLESLEASLEALSLEGSGMGSCGKSVTSGQVVDCVGHTIERHLQLFRSSSWCK